MKLYIVGSRARGTENKYSDIDFVTTDDLDKILNKFPKITKILKKGKKYTQFKSDGMTLDIWRVPKAQLKNNIILRSMDKGHYIGFVNAVKELGYSMNFNGIKQGNKFINPITFINKHPSLKKFKKHMITKIQYMII